MNITELRNAIDRHDAIYYNGGTATIDDSVYDKWKQELKALDPGDERLTRVGAPVVAVNAGVKTKHKHPMGSLDNAMNEEEFMAWHSRMLDLFGVLSGYPGITTTEDIPDDAIRYSVGYKMDGGSGAIYYQDGFLDLGATRGDGVEGENITANVLRMQGVPRYVEIPTIKGQAAVPFTGSARGEMMLWNDDWKALDPDMTSNPRNLGNGISRRRDGEDTERLRFVTFRLFDQEGKPLDLDLEQNPRDGSESGMLSTARQLGFATVPERGRFVTAAQVCQIYRQMQGLPLDPSVDVSQIPGGNTRDTLPFEIDGLVIKVESLAFQSKAGVVGNRPRAQIALKFPPLGNTTSVLSVDWSIGHTGALIPTANLEPVKIGGVTVSRALLCNMDEIARLAVAIGDLVFVVRRGDVIPKIVEVLKQGVKREPITAPTHCPACDGEVAPRQSVKGTDSVMLYCQNPECSAQQLGKIKTWVKKLDIQGLGDVFLEQLFRAFFVMEDLVSPDGSKAGTRSGRILARISDLYLLHQLKRRESFEAQLGKARVAKILAEIDKKRKLPLHLFLGSLGIDGLGRRRVQIILEKDPGQFDKLEDWFGSKLFDRADAIGLPGIAGRIQASLNDVEPLVQKLLAAGVEVTAPEPAPTKDENAMLFCITGKLSQPKAVFHDKIVAAGHTFTESYHKGLDYLVAADPSSGSSKMKKAEKDGVKVISETQLLEMLEAVTA